MAKLTVRDPMKDGAITNDARIVAALPTINYLREHGARLVLCSHLGRPEGTGYQAEFSLKAAADRLSELLGKPVAFVPETIGEAATAARAALNDGDVLLLDNVRFDKKEKKNRQVHIPPEALIDKDREEGAGGNQERGHRKKKSRLL